MAFEINDRVQETSTTTGTGNFTLLGAVSGHVTFNDAVATFNDCPYTIVNDAEWEIGYGYLSDPTTLVRNTVIRSSNAGSLVNFSAGTKSVFLPMTSLMAAYRDPITGRLTNQVDGDTLFKATLQGFTSQTDTGTVHYDASTGELYHKPNASGGGTFAMGTYQFTGVSYTAYNTPTNVLAAVSMGTGVVNIWFNTTIALPQSSASFSAIAGTPGYNITTSLFSNNSTQINLQIEDASGMPADSAFSFVAFTN